jgi:hypothetical protein
MVHPWRPNLAFSAGLSCLGSVQVSPPSVERVNMTGSGAPPKLRNSTQQTYTFPKWSLVAAVSAHSDSLSLKSVWDSLPDTSTGGIQAAFPTSPPRAAVAGSSVLETPMASCPLNPPPPEKFPVRLLKYKREPLSQEKSPPSSGCGPKATIGSPSDTNPFSKYHGRVPIGPSWGMHSSGPRQWRADQPVYSGWIQDAPPSKENWTPVTPTSVVNGQVVGSPALHASRSMLSLAPAARISGLDGSMATVGSFCLFCEKIRSLLPTVTSVSCNGVAASPGSAMRASSAPRAGMTSRREIRMPPP